MSNNNCRVNLHLCNFQTHTSNWLYKFCFRSSFNLKLMYIKKSKKKRRFWSKNSYDFTGFLFFKFHKILDYYTTFCNYILHFVLRSSFISINLFDITAMSSIYDIVRRNTAYVLLECLAYQGTRPKSNKSNRHRRR